MSIEGIVRLCEEFMRTSLLIIGCSVLLEVQRDV